MKTILELNYLKNLEEQKNTLSKDLPKPDPTIPNINPNKNPSTSLPPENPQQDTNMDPNIELDDDPKNELDPENTGEDNQFQDPSIMDPGLNNVDFSKIYELRKIYQKLQFLRKMFNKFSDVELEDLKTDIFESMYLFQKVLIPNLDNLKDRLDLIIKNYQNFIKDITNNLDKFYSKKIQEKKNSFRRK